MLLAVSATLANSTTEARVSNSTISTSCSLPQHAPLRLSLSNPKTIRITPTAMPPPNNNRPHRHHHSYLSPNELVAILRQEQRNTLIANAHLQNEIDRLRDVERRLKQGNTARDREIGRLREQCDWSMRRCEGLRRELRRVERG